MSKKNKHKHKGQQGTPPASQQSLPVAAVSNGGGSSGSQPWKRCFHDHPPYEIAPGIMIYGGSCGTPAVEDADVYIGFDGSMRGTNAGYPWNDGPVEVYFPITDMSVPKDLEEFKKMLVWTEAQLKAGKKVHAGCIGGHGRTGTFFAALRKHMTGDEDATQHVRTNYCKKVVESETQVNWLNEHFGIKKVEATKGFKAAPSSGWLGGGQGFGFGGGGSSQKQPSVWTGGSVTSAKSTGKPTNRAASIWGM